MRTAESLFQHLRADMPTATLDGWSPDLDVRTIAQQLLLKNVIRKFEGDEPVDPVAEMAAIQKFLDANKRSETWDTIGHVNTSIDEMLLGEFSSSIDAFFVEGFDRSLISDNALEHFGLGIPGPGASIGTRDTDMYHKMFDSAVSVTSGLLPIWQYCTTSDVYEPLANAFFMGRERHGIQVVSGSELTVVPKTVDVGRAIATEPSANMWMQRGLSVQIERTLKSHFGIDLSNQQEKNRLLAQIGSIDDSMVTLDLESASDTISLNLLRFFPKWFRGLVCLYRSPECDIGQGPAIKLHMISTMGNGFTFSLMTLIMCCVVDAAAKLSRVRLTRWRQAEASRLSNDRLPLTPGNWGVFGDDIICPSGLTTRLVQRLLYLLGFVVNSSKSFVEGPFRESCGGDYYRGEDVRPVFVKHLESRADLFVAFNSLSAWSANHGVPITGTLQFIARLLGDAVYRFVPLHCNADQGTRVPERFLGTGHPKDQNGSLLYRALTPVPLQVTITMEGAPISHDPIDLTKEDWETRRKKPRRSSRTSDQNNGWGITTCAIEGHIKGGTVAVRVKDRKSLRYHTTSNCTPSWNAITPETGRCLLSPGRLADVLEPVFL